MGHRPFEGGSDTVLLLRPRDELWLPKLVISIESPTFELSEDAPSIEFRGFVIRRADSEATRPHRLEFRSHGRLLWSTLIDVPRPDVVSNSDLSSSINPDDIECGFNTCLPRVFATHNSEISVEVVHAMDEIGNRPRFVMAVLSSEAPADTAAPMSAALAWPKRYRKIFVVGDSRTGTTSLHHFFTDLGYSSVHYYEDLACMAPHHPDLFRGNIDRILSFVDNSGYDAFSDYPTRLYYVALYSRYPDAAFILSTRGEVERWQQSMVRYMKELGQEIDLPELTAAYLRINEQIRTFFSGAENFLDLCIDDEAQVVQSRLNDFLGYAGPARLGRYNTVEDHLNFLKRNTPG